MTVPMKTASSSFRVDGTYKSSVHHQLYYVMGHFILLLHTLLNYTLCTERNLESFFPLLYAFLPDKTHATYLIIFSQIRNLFTQNGFSNRWETIIMDFEAAAHRAISEEFSNILRKGCNFHFGQCLWRKIQELGLTTVSNF